jgi:hypothetical protein
VRSNFHVAAGDPELLAAAFHPRRPGERSNLVFDLVLAVIAAFISYGRIVLVPFS